MKHHNDAEDSSAPPQINLYNDDKTTKNNKGKIVNNILFAESPHPSL